LTFNSWHAIFKNLQFLNVPQEYTMCQQLLDLNWLKSRKEEEEEEEQQQQEQEQSNH
jgi:hypothetical protein